VGISEITDRFVSVIANETTVPKAANVAVYQGLQELQEELARSLRPAFAQHRRLLG
jgi:hypothetical protein